MTKLTIDDLTKIENIDYSLLITSYGLEIISLLEMGSYQGDLLFLVRNDSGLFGIAATGYGSCSGCDALMGCLGYNFDYGKKQHILNKQQKKELEEVREDLCGRIIWYSAEEMVEYLNTKDWNLEFYGREKELMPWVKEIKETILLCSLAKI